MLEIICHYEGALEDLTEVTFQPRFQTIWTKNE